MDLPATAIEHLRHGRKIEAIKIVREASGLGLKEAKDAVEAYLRRTPMLAEQYRHAQSGAFGPLVVLALAIALGIAAWLFWPA